DGRCPHQALTGSTSTRDTAGRLLPATVAGSPRSTSKRAGKWRVWRLRANPMRSGTTPIVRSCTSPSDRPGLSTSSTPARWHSYKRFPRRWARTPPPSTMTGSSSMCSSRAAAGRQFTRRSNAVVGGGEMHRSQTVRRMPLRDLILYFLRLGTIGFGGPAALVGQMEKELVQERRWLTKEEFREGVAVCQSLPGPLAIQVGIFISYLRGGFWGAWAGGWALILPNFLFVAAPGALCVYFGDLPSVKAIFYGVSPAVIALIFYSCYRLAKLGMEDRLQWIVAAACFIVTVALQAEVALLFVISGAIGIACYGTVVRRWWRAPT